MIRNKFLTSPEMTAVDKVQMINEKYFYFEKNYDMST